MCHCEVHDNAEHDAAIPVDALCAFEKALDILAVYRKFGWEIAVDEEVDDRRALRESKQCNDYTDTE